MLTIAASRNTSAAPQQSPSSSISESNSDEGYKKGKSRAARKRRSRPVLSATDSAGPTYGEVRFSTRRGAKVTTYNEEDSDDFEEDDPNTVAPSYWQAEAEEEALAVHAVLKHRLKEDGNMNDDPGKQDFEYFIKWQGLAHYHATWETWSTLQSRRGSRRVENYFRKIVLLDLYMSTDPEVQPEEREKWNLDREREADALVDYMQVERVIDKRQGDDGTEYYVKWKGQYYEASTWEKASLVSNLAQQEIDRYLQRSSKLPVSNKTESNPHTRSAYKAFREQPAYIKGGELRDFQIKGINFLAHNWCRGNNVILADEMGLGKTVQTVSFMSWLRHERQQQGPFIVIVPLSTVPAWAETFNFWAPDTNYLVYTGNETSRNIIRQNEFYVDGNPKKIKFHVLLTTYEFVLYDSKALSAIKWQFMAVDEAHRLKNRDSQLYACLMDFGAPSRLLITGTPVQNNLSELSALMNFLMPGKIVVEENIDLQSEAASRKLTELTAQISPYMIRRTKQKVENDLPPKTEKIIRVELSDFQLEYYKNILTRNYAALNQGAKGQKQSLLNIMMELKKASNHPFMFPSAEERLLGDNDGREETLKALITSSGKMMLIDRLLTKLKKDNHRVLIFSQMVRMLDILGDYLQMRGYQFQRLDGTIAAGPRRMAIDHFNAPESNDFCFLLSTRAGGLGINLMTADTVILFDSDWNPQADLQAMARAHRIGQKNPVTIYRLVSKDTVEEEVLERARNKLMLEFITIQRGVTDKELSSKVARAVAEPTSAEDIDRILKKRGQKMFEQVGNQKKLEELDIDTVLENAEEHKTEQPEGLAADGGEDFLRSFEYTDVKIDLEWDDIIPKDQLERIKAEEKKKEEEKNLAALIEQNAPRKRKATRDEREERAAKKRAREVTSVDEEEEQDDSGSDDDPKRPLQEKEIRNLIKAYEKYGSMEERRDELIADAKLTGRDFEVLKATLDEVLDISRLAMKQEQDRLVALEQNENKIVTKKDKKAILFDFKGVKRLNAETLLERPVEMRMLKEVTTVLSDWRSFRVPEASKAANYTCEWGPREDGMLCVGISRHGYGAWVAIRDDPDLGLGDKFYLEEHRVHEKEERSKGDDKNVRSPGAVHLVRRANYLLSVLKDKTSNGTNMAAKKALENHHRNNKKNARRLEKSGRSSGSPTPNALRRSRLDDRMREDSTDRGDRRKDRHHSENRSADRHSSHRQHHELNGGSKLRHEHSADRDRQRSQHSQTRHQESSPSGNADERMERFFQPISTHLHRLKSAKDAKGDEKLKLMKSSLKTIGPFIVEQAKKKGSGFEMQCW